eukprot:3221041-Prymnesium_polylepis.2
MGVRLTVHHVHSGVHIHEYYSGGFCCRLRARLCVFACLRVCMSAPPQAVQLLSNAVQCIIHATTTRSCAHDGRLFRTRVVSVATLKPCA